MNFYGMNTENKSENNAGTCVFFPVTSQAVAGHSTNYSQSSKNFIREPVKVEKNVFKKTLQVLTPLFVFFHKLFFSCLWHKSEQLWEQ